MSWVHIQDKETGGATVTTQAVTLTSNVTVGNRIIVVAYTYGAGITASQVTDNLNNGGASAGKYDQITAQADPFNGHNYIYTAPITTGGSCTVTLTASASASFLSIWAGEYSGLSTATGSAAWDTTATNGATLSASETVGPTGTVSAAGELAIGGLGDTILNGTVSTTQTAPSGWTERFNNCTNNGNTIPLEVADFTPASGTTLSGKWVYGPGTDASNGYAAGIVVFNLAAAASVGGSPPSPVVYAYSSN